MPLGGSGGGGFLIEGRRPSHPREWDAEFRSISPQYFQTMGIPLLEGRPFTPQDAVAALPVAIINRTMARRFWPGESPLGKRLRRRTARETPWLTIVGIVADVKHLGRTRDAFAEVYMSYLQPYEAFPPFRFPRELVVRADRDPLSFVPALRREIRAVDKDQPISSVRTLERIHWDSVSPQRFNMLLLTVFSAIGLLLAAVGIYGVLSYLVTRRLHEIGIRVALGARRGQILAMVVAQGMGPAILGIGIGLTVAFVLARVLSTLLFGITPTDPLTFASVSVVLLGVALAACCIPGWKATKVDPLVALRHE